MSLVDVAIPALFGLLLVANPRAFFKATGDAVTDAARIRKNRRIGWLLLGVASVYLLIRLSLIAKAIS